MRASELSVRRGVTFGMAYLILVGFGLFSLSRLQLDLYPDISFPTVMVITTYTGASPEDMETLVTRPIEGAVSSVKGVEEVTSDSKKGASIVQVKFDWGHDMEQAETEIRRQLEFVEKFFPDDADEPIVFAFDPSMQPIVMMMLSGPYTQDELRRMVDDEIAPRVERLDGIASAEAAGGLEREIRVVLDPITVEAFGLDVNAVVGAIYQENLQEPGGAVEQGRLEYSVQTLGKYQSVAEIGQVVVGARVGEAGPRPLLLKEVAGIRDTFKETQRVLEVDDQPAVWVMVRKQSGANTVQAARAVMAALPAIADEIHADLAFKVIFNQDDFINDSLGNLSTTGMVGVLISFFVLLFFLRNIRSAAIVSTAMPLSVIATFVVMDQAHMTLNVLSMAGLALGIGMLVDNGIVVLENIFRMRQEGVGPWQAAIDGAGTVGLAVTASTLTTVAVFVPVLFVPGIAGVLFRDMAVTICFSLLVSLVVALTFIPLACSRLLGTKRAQRLLERSFQRTNWTRFRDLYGRGLDACLRHRGAVGLALVGMLGATGAVMVALPTEFVTQDDQSMIFASVESSVTNNLDEATAEIREVQAIFEQIVRPDERRLTALDVGNGDGFVAIFSKGVHAGVIRMPLVRSEARARTQAQIEDALREAVKDLPGIKVTIGMPFNMMGGAGDIELQIRGHDLETSRRVGLDLRERMLALPEVGEAVFSMEDRKPEVRVRFDREKMAQIGLSTASAGRTISTSVMGRVAGRFSDGGDEYDIRVRYGAADRRDVRALEHLPVVTSTGAVLPLGNVADVKPALGPVTISRLDQERVTRLTLTLKKEWRDEAGEVHGKDLGGSITRVRGVLDGYAWPEAFTWTIGGSAEDFLDSFRYLGLALLVSVLLVYMVMASQFESLRQPFIIIFSVPLAAVGVVLMFSLTGNPMDMSALIGVIMLVGVVVNNGIVMVDAANQLQQAGLSRLEAIQQAARQRLRPVLMTSATTILAMVPLALGIGEGSAGWAGMAQAVIGGLLSSTLLTLVIVPTMYTLFARREVRREA